MNLRPSSPVAATKTSDLSADMAFVDAMIPHHEMALTMAQAELSNGKDPEMRALATGIIAGQSAEIRQMVKWRQSHGKAAGTSGTAMMAQPGQGPAFIATCAALDLPQGSGAPEWVHLLPASQGEIGTFDKRGPYRVANPAAIIAASLHADPRDEHGLIIDENHASDLAAPKGGPSPARGRITAMEARADGIWGQVQWNAAGRQLLADEAYRGISPVIVHDAKGNVTRILRASLVNYANLRNLVALNQESPMSFMAELAQKLGLNAEASEADILAAVPAGGETALQAQMAAIGTALGISGGDGAAILAAAQAKPATTSTATPAEMVAMQTELTSVTTAFNALQSEIRREKAVTFVDAAIKQVRPGVKPRRDYYIARHMEDPVETEKTINAIPAFGAEGRTDAIRQAHTDAPGADLTALNAEQQSRVLHDRAVAFQSEQKAKGIAVPLFDAITHVKKDILL